MTNPPLRRKYLLFFFVFMSGAISAYDNSLNWLTQDWLLESEQNIVCKWIIENWGVGRLIEIKAVGTIIAIIIMLELIYTKYWVVIPIIFLFQFCLFFYLTCFPLDGTYNDLFAPLRWVLDTLWKIN